MLLCHQDAFCMAALTKQPESEPFKVLFSKVCSCQSLTLLGST